MDLFTKLKGYLKYEYKVGDKVVFSELYLPSFSSLSQTKSIKKHVYCTIISINQNSNGTEVVLKYPDGRELGTRPDNPYLRRANLLELLCNEFLNNSKK